MRYPERLRLARLPTPIVKLERLSAKVGKRIWVWRDDLTGGVDAGNKIRKLEFLLAEAVMQGATQVVTCGGPQSNHARATVFAARRLGMSVKLVVRQPSPASAAPSFDPASVPTSNYLLDLIGGAQMELVPYEDYRAKGGYGSFLDAAAEESRRLGQKPYVIGEGGSSALGTFGYLTAVEEMLDTWSHLGTGKKHPDSLFVAVGSGGTLAGLHLGYERLNLPRSELHAVNVCDSSAYFDERCHTLMAEAASLYGVPYKPARLNIFDGHFGAGYAAATDDDLRFYAALAQGEGLLLDPVYSGKAFQGMLEEIAKDPGRFGEDILFLHTGGVFGTFAYGAAYQRALAEGPS